MADRHVILGSHRHLHHGGLHGWCEACGEESRRRALERTVREDGYATAVRRLNVLAVYSREDNPRLHRITREDMRWLEREHGRMDRRGAASPVLTLPLLIAAIVVLVIFLLAPAFFLAAILVLAGVAVVALAPAKHPAVLTGGVISIILGALLGFFAEGQALSLALVHP